MSGDERDEQDDWLGYSGLNEREKVWLRKRRKQSAPPVFAAIFLIAAGFFLFLNSLGLLHVRNIWDFWPLVFVWMGVGRLFCDRSPAARAWGILLIAAGAVVLMFTLGVIRLRVHDASWPLALLFILLGFALLINTLERNAKVQRGIGLPTGGKGNEDRLDDVAILGGVKRKLDTQHFEGGTIMNFMGSVEIDLRRAQINSAARSATVEVKVISGAVKIRIPETWRLNLQGSSVLGVFEDKTIPPNIGRDAPVLVITGYSALSAVEIEN